MITVKAKSLGDFEGIMLSSFNDFKRDITQNLLENLIDFSPEATGTLRNNWNIIGGSNPGKQVIENTGRQVSEKAIPNFSAYKRNFKVLTIYNRTPYIEHVNNGESGNSGNQNFIQKAIAVTKNAKFG